MYILALDSTAPTATVSVSSFCEDSETVSLKGLYTINTNNTHSETLLPMIENLLSSLSIDIDDIDIFAFSAGPGSFTGVRIGTATIKGLAFAQNKPCIGVSALEALALNLSGFNGIVCPVMNARRNQLYTAIFTSDGKSIKRIMEDSVISTDELKVKLQSMITGDEPVYFTGDGYSIAHNAIALKNITKTPELLRYQNAYSVSAAAYEKYMNRKINENYTDSEAIPIYLRPSQAEREKNKSNKKIAGDN